ncbi:MAG TPA: DUF6790 family protein [Gemmatimonadaceae bacterium]|nr:DUF6790 family protein [Gemmatimonadaceae bacterium]
MYYLSVVALLVVLPLASMGYDLTRASVLGPALVMKWMVFWAAGVRLALAGARQIAQPEYTARTILGLQHDESQVVVRELGYANLAIGIAGMASHWMPSWRMAVGLTGGLFYLLAGVGHVRKARRNGLENMAMVSDFYAGAVMLVALAIMLFGRP